MIADWGGVGGLAPAPLVMPLLPRIFRKWKFNDWADFGVKTICLAKVTELNYEHGKKELHERTYRSQLSSVAFPQNYPNLFIVGLLSAMRFCPACVLTEVLHCALYGYCRKNQ